MLLKGGVFLIMFGYIYLTTNLINGKVYVGKHKSSHYDKNYIGSGTILNKAIKKYGKNNFSCEILYKANSLEELNLKEIEFISLYKQLYKNSCYNVATGGDGGDTISNKTFEEKEKFIEKMTIINRERCSSEEFKNKISVSNKARYSNISEREKQSKRIKEAWTDTELRKKQSEKIKEYYSAHKKDNSYLNKKCVFMLDGKILTFNSIKDLRAFLLEEYGYNPDRRTFQRLLKDGLHGIPFSPFHKNKLKALHGMIIYCEQNWSLETNGDECSQVGQR